MKPAARMEHLSPHFFASLNSRLTALQAEGRQIIRLDEGSPDLPPAPHIIDKLVEVARRPDTHSYQPHRGSAALRQAWADWYLSQFNVELDPESEIIPLLGSKEGIFHLSQALLEPGDLVLAPDPGYVTYTRGALFAGAELSTFSLDPESGFLPDLDSIPVSALNRAKIMWLNFPNNPTAAVASLELFARAVALAEKHGFILCHDAAYVRIAYDGEQPPSLLQVPGAKQVSVEFNTLSKSHNMAGWRSGVLLGNPQVLRTLFTLKTNADSGHFRPILEASTVALNGDQTWLKQRNAIYQNRRDLLWEGLQAMGLSPRKPRASLYIWSPVPPEWNCEAFATAALEQAGVSLTPGTVFGPSGKGYVRLSLTAPMEALRVAVERLGNWLAEAQVKKSLEN